MHSDTAGFVILFRIVFWSFIICMYFLPSIVAKIRKHHKKNAIYVVNTVAGFTAIGWVAALIWAFVDKQPTARSTADEISKLAQLRDKNVITNDEFEAKKAALLSQRG